MYKGWNPQDVVAVLGTLSAFVAAVGVAAAKVIAALKEGMQQVSDQLRQHEAASQNRTRLLLGLKKVAGAKEEKQGQ